MGDMLALNKVQGAESKTYALSYSINHMRLYQNSSTLKICYLVLRYLEKDAVKETQSDMVELRTQNIF